MLAIYSPTSSYLIVLLRRVCCSKTMQPSQLSKTIDARDLRTHHASSCPRKASQLIMCARCCFVSEIPSYKMNCRRPAKIEVAPMNAGKGGITTASAELDLVGDEPLVPEGLVPAPPGLATAPWQK